MYYQARRIRTAMPDLKAPTDSYKNGAVEDFHILSLGESSIASIGVDSQQHGLTGYLSNMIERQIKEQVSYEVVARSGYKASNVRTELVPQIQSSRADLILIGLGANDSFQISQPREWRKNLSAILDHLQERFGNVPVVFINTPPITEFPIFTSVLKYFVNRQLLLLRDELMTLIDEYDHAYFIAHFLTAIGFIEKYKLEDKQISHFYSDGVHPSQLTYRLWAKEIFEFLVSSKLLK